MTILIEVSQIDDRDLEMLLLIRHTEQGLLDSFSRRLNGTTHTCIGQEHVPVALRGLLRESDFELSNHRGHGHYIARFDDPAGLIAEIMGVEGAVNGGVGGSQHIYRDRQYASTGIQGEALPVGVGAAIELKRQKKGALVAVHIGDGTWGAGGVYEALNLAKLWRLPLVVLVENNRIAQSTRVALHMAGTVEARAAAFGIRYARISTVDVNRIRDALREPFETVRSSSEPLIVEFEVNRLGPHSKGDDIRPSEEIERLKESDWYVIYKKSFPEQFERIEGRVVRRVREIFREVEGRPRAVWSRA